jgi:hypothetical protein
MITLNYPLYERTTVRPERRIYGESSGYRWQGYDPFKDELPVSKTVKTKKYYNKYKSKGDGN